MDKVKITGIRNKDKFNYLIVKKRKSFFEWLCNVLYNSFESVPDVDVKEYVDYNDKFVSNKKKIKDYTDKHEIYEADSRDTRIDIFYRKNKVFLTIQTSLEKREKLMDNLEKYSNFVEYKGNWKPEVRLK